MSTIAFVLDHQEGHLIPTFPLARRLVERGHRVVYMTLADGGDFVRQNGFESALILERLYPRGTVQTLREGPGHSKLLDMHDLAAKDNDDQHEYVQNLVEDPGLAEAVRDLRPDLLLVSSIFPLSALILRCRFDVPLALLTPYLRKTTKVGFCRVLEDSMLKMAKGSAALFKLVLSARPKAQRLSEVTEEFLHVPEIVLCPEALEIPDPGRSREPEVYYIEAPVGRERRSEKENDFPWKRLDPGKKLLLCSMGSQSYLVGPERLRRFYAAVAEVAAREWDWQLVLASGGQVEAADLPELPEDAVVTRWIPQLALLQKATAMITHGGLGALREAISNGVPVMVFPYVADQPANAERVAHHGLGLAGSLDTVTANELQAMLRRIDDEPRFRAGVARMRERFREAERAEVGIQLLEKWASREPQTTWRTA